jgi:phosphohistidine phosphatase
MNLYIVRHGIAVERGAPGVKSDEERRLTDEGKEKTREVAEGLAALGVEVDLLLTSPLARAEETAEILAAVLHPKRMKQTESLAPGFAMTDLCEAILAEGKAENVMIVGHEPDFSELISTLVWGDDSGGLVMRKAGVALLSLKTLPPDEGGAALEWLLPPKVLRRVKA